MSNHEDFSAKAVKVRKLIISTPIGAHPEILVWGRGGVDCIHYIYAILELGEWKAIMLLPTAVYYTRE